ncbi:MAG: hypothetical protein PHX04_04565 [Bacilli bacterium]|nr:hypothetical protein [Bacilli bacterium]
MKKVTHSRIFLEKSDLLAMKSDEIIIVNRILLNSKSVKLKLQEKQTSEEYVVINEALTELNKRDKKTNGMAWGCEMKVKDALLVFGNDEQLPINAFREKRDYKKENSLSKTAKIKRTILQLETLKLEAEKLIIETAEEIKQKNQELAQCYQDFYQSKTKTEFVLYDKFPSADILELYVRNISDKFPLYNDGNLNVKEVAELIKHCYQFQKDSEYDVLTIGVNELEGSPVYGGLSWSVNPHLYFMIGNNKTLAPYQEYNGQYVNEDKLYSQIYLNAQRKDLISIELDSGYLFPKIDIECLTGNKEDIPGKINYYNSEARDYRHYDFGKLKNIFDYNLRNKVGQKGRYGYNGIKDVLDFRVHVSDTFLAKILISVCIYKRNNGISELSSEDYNHIFDVLYGEKVDIKGQSEIDIPKKLIYVPNKQCGK